MVMKSIWSTASNLTERAKSYAGDYLKQDNTILKDLEVFKKETITLLDDKTKENAKMQEILKKKTGIIAEQDTKIKKLIEHNHELTKEINQLRKEKELIQKENETMTRKMNNEQIDVFKDVIVNNFNKLKIEINNYDIDINQEIQRQLKEIKINNENINVDTISNTILSTKTENSIEIDNQNQKDVKIKESVTQEDDNTNKGTNNNNSNRKEEEMTNTNNEIKEETGNDNNSNTHNPNNDKRKKRKKNKRNSNNNTTTYTNQESQKKQDEVPTESSIETTDYKPVINDNDKQPSSDENTPVQIQKDDVSPTSSQSESQINNNTSETNPIITKQSSIDLIQLSNILLQSLTPLLETQKTSFASYLNDNISTIHSKLDQLSQTSQTISSENISLQAKLSQLETSNSVLEQQLQTLQGNHTILTKEHQSLEALLTKSNEEKDKFQADLNSLLEQHHEISSSLQALKTTNASLQSDLSKEKGHNQTLIQLLKQFFLLFLIDDIFIDSIESIFNNATTDDKFIEKIYQLAKYIKPKIGYDYHKEFLINNQDVLRKINKYNLETNIEELQQNYDIPLSNLDQLLKYNYQENDFIISLMNELVLYIDNLTKTIMTQSNKYTELNQTIKQSEENKKTENDHLNSLQNELKEKNGVINSFDKITKESKQLKGEIETLNSKIAGLINDKSVLNQDKQNLTDKLSLVNQQCEVFKVENSELINRITDYQKELNQCKNKTTSMSKEILLLSDIKIQHEKKEKMIKDYQVQLSNKELDYKKMQNSYMELESFFENAKKEKEIVIENHKNQINEYLKQIDNLQLQIQTAKEKEVCHQISNNDHLQKEYEALEAKVTSLEIENKNIKEQKDKMKSYSEEILKRVQNDFKESEFMIDKRMINSLLFKYFDPYTNSGIKQSLLETISNFMNYSNEERKQLGLSCKANGNEPNLTQNNTIRKDKLKDLGEELFDFITNS